MDKPSGALDAQTRSQELVMRDQSGSAFNGMRKESFALIRGGMPA